MKKLSALLIFSNLGFGLTTLPLRALYLKVIQEPTGTNFRVFKKACLSGGEKISFINDNELLTSLKPKKHFNGVQVHSIVTLYKNCLAEDSKAFLNEPLVKEVLGRHLRKWVAVSCTEKLSREELQAILSLPNVPLEKIKARLKTVPPPKKCPDLVSLIENILSSIMPTHR